MPEPSKGFSLMEIVIALGVISFALVGIIGLIPTALGAASESRHETRAAGIARLMFGQMRTHDPKKKAMPLGPDPVRSGVTDGNLNLSLQTGITNTGLVAFDEDGRPLIRMTDAQFTSDTTSGRLAGAAYKVRLRVTPNQPFPGLARLVVDVTYPPSAPLTSRTVHSFSLLLNNVSP